MSAVRSTARSRGRTPRPVDRRPVRIDAHHLSEVPGIVERDGFTAGDTDFRRALVVIIACREGAPALLALPGCLLRGRASIGTRRGPGVVDCGPGRFLRAALSLTR
jgi:hypothetical protein